MSSQATVHEGHAEPDAATPQQSGKSKNALRHNLANELAVVIGFAWLALTALRQLGEKLGGTAQTELQSIISMVERTKSSAEEGRRLLTVPHRPIGPPIDPSSSNA